MFNLIRRTEKIVLSLLYILCSSLQTQTDFSSVPSSLYLRESSTTKERSVSLFCKMTEHNNNNNIGLFSLRVH